MITLKDVARALGVAPSTVGRALADHPHVHERTKARVRAAAAEMGYVGHLPARVMRGGRSALIGLTIPDVRNDFYSTAAQAISEACARDGYQVVLCLTGDAPDRERDQLRGLVAARCAGVIVVGTGRMHRETVALRDQVPHVQLIRRARGLHAPWFGIDDTASTRLAVEHLVALGHRDLGYVGGDLELSTGAERFRGFREAMAAAGLASTARWCEHGSGDEASGRVATHRVLGGARRPTALVLAGSRLTAGALAAIRELEIGVPRELSVVGFNDAGALGWWGSGVTSVGLPVGDIALACASGLLAALRASSPGAPAGETQAGAQVAATFAPYLVERGSTAAPESRKRARAA